MLIVVDSFFGQKYSRRKAPLPDAAVPIRHCLVLAQPKDQRLRSDAELDSVVWRHGTVGISIHIALVY